MPTVWKFTLEIEIKEFQTSRRRKYSTCVCRSDSEEVFVFFLPLDKYNICNERDHEKAENGLRPGPDWIQREGRTVCREVRASWHFNVHLSSFLRTATRTRTKNDNEIWNPMFAGGYMKLGLSLVLLSKKKKKDSYFWSNFPLLFRKLSLNDRYKKGYNCSICAMILMKALFCK